VPEKQADISGDIVTSEVGSKFKIFVPSADIVKVVPDTRDA